MVRTRFGRSTRFLVTGRLNRMVQNYVFLKGIGKPYNGIRTRFAALSALVNMALFLTVLCGVFF